MKKRTENHESKTFGIYLDYSHLILPFKFLLCPQIFLLCAKTISDHNTTCIPCAILELSGTIPESADKVGIPTLRRTIPELSRFLHCAEHTQIPRLVCTQVPRLVCTQVPV